MILTDDEICKAVGARAASERWLKDAQAIESALLEKLRAGMELPEPKRPNESGETLGLVRWQIETPNGWIGAWDKQALDYVIQYGDARALAASKRETCTWTEQDDKDMPGTYESSCGEMWSFIDGGVKENRVTYCHHCGGKVVPASPQEQT